MQERCSAAVLIKGNSISFTGSGGQHKHQIITADPARTTDDLLDNGGDAWGLIGLPGRPGLQGPPHGCGCGRPSCNVAIGAGEGGCVVTGFANNCD